MIIYSPGGVSRDVRRLTAALLALTLAAACGASTAPTTASRVASATTSLTPSVVTTASPTVASPGATAATQPAFLTYAFTNVRDGSKFTLSDFSGKSVLVIGMAVW